jgi:hypothetical protein
MMKEKLLMKFKLPMLQNMSTIQAIVTMGYKETGNKFSVAYNGSKGYLSNIEISCEGKQNHRLENRIFIERYRNKDNSVMSKMVSIYHSEENGLRIEVAE